MNLYTAQKVRQWLGQSGGLRQKVELPPGRPPYSGLTLGLEEELRMKGADLEGWEGCRNSEGNSQFSYTYIARAGSFPHPPSLEDWFWGHRVNLISLSHVNFHHALPLSFCSWILRSSPISPLKNLSCGGYPQG